MEFVIQPLDLGKELSPDAFWMDKHCVHNNVAECGCVHNNVVGCNCSGSGTGS